MKPSMVGILNQELRGGGGLRRLVGIPGAVLTQHGELGGAVGGHCLGDKSGLSCF